MADTRPWVMPIRAATWAWVMPRRRRCWNGFGRIPHGRVCSNLAAPRRADRQTRVLHWALGRLNQRIILLACVVNEMERQIAVITAGLGPTNRA
jgi:hypothetical protein